MAQFLATNGNTYLAEGMLISANEYLYIFSPNFKLNAWLLGNLKKTAMRSVEIAIISNEWLEEDLSVLKDFEGITCYRLSGLKATCILDKSKALLTSFNISDWGKEGDRHAGVLVEASQDINLYKSLKQEMLSNLNLASIINCENGIVSNDLVLA